MSILLDLCQSRRLFGARVSWRSNLSDVDQPPATTSDDGEALMLLPGLLCDAALWRWQIEAFAPWRKVIVADLARDDALVGMAARTLETAPPRFALAALSMGGYVALEILRQAPERVTRVALLDTSARPDSPETAARRRGLVELAARGRFRGVTPRLLPLLLHPDRLADAELTGTIMAMAERIGPEGYRRQQTAILGRADARGLLARVACPTLVLCGRQDAITPLDHSEEMAAAIPGARLVVLEECGHLSCLERPERVNAAMRDWLGAR